MTRWLLLIVQLFIGASLTAIGPTSLRNGTPITVLGAVNTIVAGLLALLHNSGLPDRYRYDMTEFEQLEDHIRELLDTGLAPADRAIDQVLAECFEMYAEAKLTIQANMPATYNSRKALHNIRQECHHVAFGSTSRCRKGQSSTHDPWRREDGQSEHDHASGKYECRSLDDC